MTSPSDQGSRIDADGGARPDCPDSTLLDAIFVARLLKVHPRTVQRWILLGKLRGHRIGNVRSRLRVTLGDVVRAFESTDRPRYMAEAMIRFALGYRGRGTLTS